MEVRGKCLYRTTRTKGVRSTDVVFGEDASESFGRLRVLYLRWQSNSVCGGYIAVLGRWEAARDSFQGLTS